MAEIEITAEEFASAKVAKYGDEVFVQIGDKLLRVGEAHAENLAWASNFIAKLNAFGDMSKGPIGALTGGIGQGMAIGPNDLQRQLSERAWGGPRNATEVIDSVPHVCIEEHAWSDPALHPSTGRKYRYCITCGKEEQL